MTGRVYLAGPEVFLEDAASIFEQKKAICQRYGFHGVSPLESHVDVAGGSRQAIGYQISQANEACMRSCHALIANLTPFRSPSADPGTSHSRGRQKPPKMGVKENRLS